MSYICSGPHCHIKLDIKPKIMEMPVHKIAKGFCSDRCYTDYMDLQKAIEHLQLSVKLSMQNIVETLKHGSS